MADKTEYQAQLFKNRLSKKYRELRKWARKNRISCYRVYDKDIPEIPVAVDFYEFLPADVCSTIDCARFMGEQNQRIANNDPLIEKECAERRYVVLFLYERPYEKDLSEERNWLMAMKMECAKVFSVLETHIIVKERKRQKGENQYEKTTGNAVIKGVVQEQGQLFNVDLTTYLDSFLFFDHRPLRSIVRDNSSGKRVLNLFCYTGSFSVYAASGNASFIESVDLSNTYLNVAKDNMALNGFCDSSRYVYNKGDVFAILDEKIKKLNNSSESEREKLLFDIIVLDPPTFSNSKMSDNMLDINRQWPILVNKCVSLLAKKGVLYFSTNSRRLSFDESYVVKAINGGMAVFCEDITSKTIPEDFKNTKCHRCWQIFVSQKKCEFPDGFVERKVEFEKTEKNKKDEFHKKEFHKSGFSRGGERRANRLFDLDKDVDSEKDSCVAGNANIFLKEKSKKNIFRIS